MPNDYTLVTGAVCPRCEDIIFSRARHDFHLCSCEGIMVDGGFDYLRYGSMQEDLEFKDIKTIKIYVLASKEELYKDYNKQINKYGLIKNKRLTDNKEEVGNVYKIDSGDQ